MPTKPGPLARGAQSDAGYKPGKEHGRNFEDEQLLDNEDIPSDVLDEWEGAFARDESGESAGRALKQCIDELRKAYLHMKDAQKDKCAAEAELRETKAEIKVLKDELKALKAKKGGGKK